jgi:hypothetical protein
MAGKVDCDALTAEDGVTCKRMKAGTCGLCRKLADLHDSHLLPSALYKFMKEPSLKNPNPIRIVPGVAVASSLEIRQHFLCAACEHRLNTAGEKWILANCAQPDGSFPLHDNLTAVSAIDTIGHVTLYRSKGVVGIEPEQISYFASSVFWRAAATDWRNHYHRLELGPYEERFRRYLLGEQPFPDNAALRVVISSPPEAKLLAMLPMSDRIHGMRSHTFLIPGMILTLILAQHIPVELKRLALSPSPDYVIGVSDEMYRAWIRAIAGQVRSVEPKGYLQDFWNGPNPRLRT